MIQISAFSLITYNYFKRKKMSYLAVILFLTITQVAHLQTLDPNYTYQDFMRQFNRSYTGQEKEKHKKIFQQEYRKILQQNQKGRDLRVNEFLDWNQTQNKVYFGFDFRSRPVAISSPTLRASQLFASPASFDWKTRGVVTDVKRQGRCGSCWAHAANAVYESLYAIATNGTKLSFSQQYTMQCTGQTSIPCVGGVPNQALQLLNKTGAPLSQKYPYQGEQSQNYWPQNSVICNDLSRIKINRPTIKLQHFQTLTTQQIQQYLVEFGPVSVGVNGSTQSFRQASPYEIKCPKQDSIDHAILLYGYNQTHWFVKNSWGTNWADGGFGYIDKNHDCNLHTYIDVLQIDFGFNPSPNPAPNPAPIPPGEMVTLEVTLTDSYGDGWNKNQIGIKQNGTYVATFGQKFISGKTYGPFNITISSKLQSQIVVFKYGSYQYEVGFSIKYLNGSLIYSRTPGGTYQSNTIFFTFCPGSCGSNSTSLTTFYLIMTDYWGDGWNGIVLAFRQEGVYQNFTLANGFSNSNSPLPFSFKKSINVDIVVYKFGFWSQQIGFQIKTFNGAIVFQRTPGKQLSANVLVGSFCPECLNYDYVGIVLSSEEDTKVKGSQSTSQDSGESMKKYNGYQIATYVIAPLLVIFIVVVIVLASKLTKTKKQFSSYKEQDNVTTGTSAKVLKSEIKI